MNKVIPFPAPKAQRESVQEEAGLWLARLAEGLSPAQQDALESWLALRPMHREVFLEMAALWDSMESLRGLAALYPLDEYRPRLARRRTRLWVAAAAAVAMIAIVTLFPRVPERLAPAGAVQGTETFQAVHQTAIGEQRSITLPDGSTVVLNTNSSLEVVYGDKARNLFLTRGEAYFTVTRDASRPFRVYAGWRMAEAVGTAFTVLHADPESVEVIVREGKVRLHDLRDSYLPDSLPANVDDLLEGGDKLALEAGDLAAASSIGRPAEKRRIDADQLDIELAWTYGMLLFQDKTLGAVLDEVSRYTTIHLEAAPDILPIAVEGYFPAGDVERLLIALEKNFGIAATRVSEGHIRLHSGTGENDNP